MSQTAGAPTGRPLSRRALREAERRRLEGRAAPEEDPKGAVAAPDVASAVLARGDDPGGTTPEADAAVPSGAGEAPDAVGPASTDADSPDGPTPAAPADGVQAGGAHTHSPGEGGDPAPDAGASEAGTSEPGTSDAQPQGAEPPPQKTSRAGRDLPMAIGVGLGLGALLLVCLFVRKEAFVALALVAVGGALWEFSTALRSRGIRVPLLPLFVGAAGMLLSAYIAGPEALVVAFMLTAGGVFVWRVIDGGGTDALRDAGAGIFAAAYLPFLASFAVLMIAAPDGAWRVLYAISLVVANDVGGYAAGVLFGKHPMAPTVSPKKSWEGAAGSAVLAALVGVGLMWWFFDGPLWAGAAIGLLTVAAATVGDLSESLIKRDLGLKDMGTLLPGHGGIMDRLDSMLVAAPVVYGSLTVTLAIAS